MQPGDFAKRKVFEVLEATRRPHSWGRDRDLGESYETVVKILEARAAKLAVADNMDQQRGAWFVG
jgi:hypothetical protein